MELANFIVEAVLKQAVTDKIVVYSGRFQPFHKGHKKVYDALVSKFGSKNVYIATSDVQDSDKSPLSFNDKKEIATKLFGIPSSKFVKVKQPYQPVEILRGYDDVTTALIVAVGEKDDSRLGGNYFKPYTNDKNLKGYAVNAYVYSALPSNSFGATDVRNMFRNNRMGGERKQKEFEKFFGKFDKAIYTKLITKLNEGLDNKIPGGLADEKTLVDIAKKYAGAKLDYEKILDFVKEQMKLGIKAEMEHTSDVRIAAEIAKDHLWEKLTYYKDLQQIEPDMYQPHNPVKEDSIDYENDSTDLENIYNTEFSDPSTGRKMRIKDALQLDPQDFAHQEAMRLLRVMLAQKHRQVPGNIGKGQQSPKTDKPKQVNLSLYNSYSENIDEASAAGSGYDEKVLDQLVDNPDTGEKVKVRSALNYDKNHPAYRAAMAIVAKSGAKVQPNQQQRPAEKPQQPQNRNAGGPMTGANNRVGAKPTPGANNQNGTNSTNKTQKPLEKPLTNPAQAQEKPQQSQSQQTVSVDKVKKDIPNFKVSDKSDIGKVSVKQRREVSMKINDLDKLAKDAKAKGEKAPNFNLCDITIPGTNLYCSGNKGIPREQMPQFKGKPQPGSIADGLPKDKDGEVDTEAMFKKMLEDKGIKVSEPTTVPADQLKATQTELVGSKVAGMSKALDADPNNPGITAPIYVSSDGYVLDGHHRWAAVTSHEIMSGKEAMMNVRVIDMPIDQLVKESNQFAQDIGVQAKAADANKETPTNGIQPTKGTTNATDNGEGKVDTKAHQNPKVTAATIKHNISKMPNEAKQIFKTGQHKANSPLRSYIGKTLNNTMQNIVPNVKQEMQHLGNTYQSAGQGLSTLFDGKPVGDREKDAIKKMAQVLSVSSIKSIDNKDKHSKALMQHLGKHLAAHIADDIVRNGVGKVTQNSGAELDGDTDKFVEWFGLYFAQQMKEGDIPLDVWDSAIQDYHKDKEDGNIDSKRDDTNEDVIVEESDSGAVFGMSFGDYDANMGDYVGGNMTVSDITANANSANSTTGKEHNGTWQEFDNQTYYTGRLAGWQVIGHLSNSLPDEVKNRVLPIFNHSGTENGPAAHTLQKIVGPEKIKYEGINVDVKKGDEILTGKFKNKKTTVKDIGEDPHGMPTINGRQATTFRTTEMDEVFDTLKEYGVDVLNREMVKSLIISKENLTKALKYAKDPAAKKKIDVQLKDIDKLIKSYISVREQLGEGLLIEGGAYGHMNHPFDVRMNLSFGDLKAIVNNALDGNLGVVREKTDGQALAISWKNGRLISARNKGHLANAGANAMDINGVATKFGGRGGLTDAYNFAMKDLENAIRGLSQAQKDKIFKEGKVFVNLEVIWPTSVNVIPYNQALLVFHNAVEYNEAGNPVGKIDGAESVLGGMIKQINAHVQSKYTIQGPPIVTLPKTKQLSSQKGKFKAMISKLQSEFNLTDKDGVADYHQAWWENFVDKSKKKISGLEKAGLVKRWAFDDKSMRIGDIKDDAARAWAEGIDKGPKTTIMSGNLRKFEDIFLGVGAEVLSFMGSVLTAQPDKALQSMRAELESTASQIMSGGTITQIKKLEKELSRLNAIGGFEKIVPSEGIVFSYKGNAYKLTGAFAPLNQILGIFKFSR